MAPLNPAALEVDEYNPPAFRNTPSISELHGRSRGGYPNDIKYLLDGDSDQQSDYLRGVFLASVISLSCFTFWFLLLLIFKICGTRRVGFLAGKPPSKPQPPGGYIPYQQQRLSRETASRSGTDHQLISEQGRTSVGLSDADYGDDGGEAGPKKSVSEIKAEVSAWRRRIRKIHNNMKFIRVVSVICGLLVIGFSIVFLVKGVQGLRDSISTTEDGLGDIQRVCQAGIDLIDRSLNSTAAVQNDSATGAEIVNANWCPKRFTELCYSDGNGGLICDYSDTPLYSFLQPVRDELVPIVERTREELNDEVLLLRKDLVTLSDAVGDTITVVNSFNWAFWVAFGFTCLLIVVVLIIMYGIYLAGADRLTRCFKIFRGAVIIPLFFVNIILVIIFESVFVIGGTLASDFCYDSPNDLIVSLLGSVSKKDFESFAFRQIIWYIEGCPGESPAEGIFREVLKFLEPVVEGMHSLIEALLGRTTELEESCGTDETIITEALELGHNVLHIIYDITVSIRSFFFCETFNGIYTKFVYDAVCYDAVDGLRWSYISLIWAVFFAMTMATLRAAWYEIEEESDESPSGLCCQRQSSRGAEASSSSDDSSDGASNSSLSSGENSVSSGSYSSGSSYGESSKPSGQREQALPLD